MTLCAVVLQVDPVELADHSVPVSKYMATEDVTGLVAAADEVLKTDAPLTASADTLPPRVVVSTF